MVSRAPRLLLPQLAGLEGEDGSFRASAKQQSTVALDSTAGWQGTATLPIPWLLLPRALRGSQEAEVYLNAWKESEGHAHCPPPDTRALPPASCEHRLLELI